MEIEVSPYTFFENLQQRSRKTLDAGASIVTSGRWDDLPEYFEEVKQTVVAFEQLVPFLTAVHDDVVEQARIREETRLAEIERRRLEKEEKARKAAEFEQQVEVFKTAFLNFKVKPSSWALVNVALAAGEIVEQSALFQNDKRAASLATMLQAVRERHQYLSDVRTVAAEMLAEAQAGEKANESGISQA